MATFTMAGVPPTPDSEYDLLCVGDNGKTTQRNFLKYDDDNEWNAPLELSSGYAFNIIDVTRGPGANGDDTWVIVTDEPGVDFYTSNFGCYGYNNWTAHNVINDNYNVSKIVYADSKWVALCNLWGVVYYADSLTGSWTFKAGASGSLSGEITALRQYTNPYDDFKVWMAADSNGNVAWCENINESWTSWGDTGFAGGRIEDLLIKQGPGGGYDEDATVFIVGANDKIKKRVFYKNHPNDVNAWSALSFMGGVPGTIDFKSIKAGGVSYNTSLGIVAAGTNGVAYAEWQGMVGAISFKKVTGVDWKHVEAEGVTYFLFRDTVNDDGTTTTKMREVEVIDQYSLRWKRSIDTGIIANCMAPKSDNIDF